MNELFSSIGELIYSTLALGIVIALFVGFFKFMDWLASDKKNSTPQEEKEIDTESGTATSKVQRYAESLLREIENQKYNQK